MGPKIQQQTANARRPVLADPYYYLNNFRAALTSLEDRYWALFSAEERQFIRGFAALPARSSALLVRMIMRVGLLFRLSRLVYAEIGDISSAAAPLLEIKWLEEPILDVSMLHRLLTRSELAVCLPLARGAPPTRQE